ncbi:MAG: hypothetical protein OIF38_18345, partial [Cellvibrionaceae bacterium]|nr:hypothetical protein [Cellvibrionaceae bacterium]
FKAEDGVWSRSAHTHSEVIITDSGYQHNYSYVSLNGHHDLSEQTTVEFGAAEHNSANAAERTELALADLLAEPVAEQLDSLLDSVADHGAQAALNQPLAPLANSDSASLSELDASAQPLLAVVPEVLPEVLG